MGDKFFFKPVGAEGDLRLRFRIRTSKGKVVEFMVQLEFRADGDWKPVVRYDNAHDFAHRDVLDWRGNEIEKTPLRLGTLPEILEYAEQDLMDRADWYADRFLKTRRTQ